MIELQQASKGYGTRLAVDRLDLSIQAGEFVVLIGPSGSGKSTTLRMMNRLVACDSGTIRFAGQDIHAHPVEALRRRMGYAIQSVGLFPHWTVSKNIGTVPRLLGWPPDRIHQRTHALLELLQLEPSQFAHRYPDELSGGQQQRVGVARALAAEPEVLLMDEPFGALDQATRLALQRELKRIQALSGTTVVLVTHDLDEALFLASRIVLLNNGRIVQDGTPLQLLLHPVNNFVRDFVGRAELGLRVLGLGLVRGRFRHGACADGIPIHWDMSLREAISAFIVQGRDALPVVDSAGVHTGALHLSDLLQADAL